VETFVEVALKTASHAKGEVDVKGLRQNIWWCYVLMVSLLLVQPIAWGAEPKPGGTLRVAWEADVTGFDPGFSRGIQSYYLKGNLFNPLVTVDENLNFVPELAESWETQENGKVYVFHLRKGVKFHDGTDFNAEAVRWNILWTTNPESQSVMDAFLDTIETVEVIDAHTVKIILKYPTFTLLPALAQYREGLLIKSPTAYEKFGKQEATRNPVGTGPFKLGRWDQNNLIVLEKNKDYWKPGLPYLDRVELKIMKDGVTRATAIRAGEVDYVSWMPREHADRVKKDPKIQLWAGKGSATAFSAFNVSLKPFDDQRVRIAVAGYGIDRVAIAKAALLGYGGPQWSYLPPGAKGHKDFPELYPYNPEKARALLKEAGFDEQNPLQYSIITHTGETALPTMATIMKTQLAKIGVQLNVEVLDRPIFLKRINGHDYQQLLNASSHMLDAYDRASSLDRHAGVNIPYHQDPKVDELLDHLRRASTEDEYIKAGENLQEYATKQMMYFGVATLPDIEAARDTMQGYVFMRGFKKRFETVWVNR
jgi:ABC-type transport system substrate-binding protein